MANFTIIVDSGAKFNIKAQSGDQAVYKACDFVLDYPVLAGQLTAYSKGTFFYDESLPFITMTSAGFKRRYKINPNTNKKVIALLLESV